MPFDVKDKSLEDALAALSQGNNPGAKQQLGAFITQVETLESQGGLPSSEADLLVSAANGVIAQL